MSKIIIPIDAVKIGGALNSFYYDNAILRSDVITLTDETNATADGVFDLSIADVGSILDALGDTEGYLMAVQTPIALLDLDVPDPLPNNKTLNGQAVEVFKKFSDWFNTGAEIWKKDDDTEIIFYTNPFASNESSYLKGSEIAIINDIGGTVNILTIAQAEAETATGWTKV